MNTITKTNYTFPYQKHFYKGKVRDVYILENNLVVMIATDRISAFDKILSKGIPYKGQIINQLATRFMAYTREIVPNWLLAVPDPNVSIGVYCQPIKIEMIIRGYLAGHLARIYAQGERQICGVKLPNNLRENDKLPTPIITPSTKADVGTHDEDISRDEIIQKGIIREEDYCQLEKYTYALFQKGSEIADKRGLILVDTKYEFGKTTTGKIILIDEIHTPDSSRYFYKKNYLENQQKGIVQKQLSKEFVRQWLIKKGFQGNEGESIPLMSEEYVTSISQRYIELYEHLLAEKFVKSNTVDISERIEKQVNFYLNTL